MVIRKLWVSSLSGDVVFSKAFPTVERRAKMLNDSGYCTIPCDAQIGALILDAVGLGGSAIEKFTSHRDTCCKVEKKPVFEVNVHEGKLWPVLIIEQLGFLFCALPLVEGPCDPRPPLITIPPLSVAFSVLLAMADFLRQSQATTQSNKFLELYEFVSEAMPFGVPWTLDNSDITGQKAGIVIKKLQTRVPAWKTIPHKGKCLIQLNVFESVRCVQYDREDTADECEVYGTILCRADLEGLAVDVSFSVISRLKLSNILLHPCVQRADADLISDSTDSKFIQRFQLTPPTESFVLCHYTATVSQPPLAGFYQMKMDGMTASLLVQVKLTEHMKNAFDYLEVQLPFYNKGKIAAKELNVSAGSVVVANDEMTLVWNVGQTLPAKSLEVTLTGKVDFKEDKKAKSGGSREQQFCVGVNGFAKVFFKMKDFCISGSRVDMRSVLAMCQAKPKTACMQELVTFEYKIWNSHGDAMRAHSSIAK